jgi:hypothetical protein
VRCVTGRRIVWTVQMDPEADPWGTMTVDRTSRRWSER